MRYFWVIACGILLSVQSFANVGGTGKMGRSIKELLRNQPLVNQVAEWAGTSAVGVSSRNLGQVLAVATFSAAMLLGVNGAVDADINKRVAALDKKIDSAVGKGFDLGNGVALDASGTVYGNWSDYSDSAGKADTFSAGFGSTLNFRKALTTLSLQGKIMSNHTKQAGADDYTGGEDYTGRIDLVQAIPLRDSPIQPLLYAEGGGAQFYNNKRQVDASGGIGFQASRVLFGKEMHLQVRGGFGYLGEGKYGNSEFADIEGDAVLSYGATLKTGWVSWARFLGAQEGTILDYIPAIPNATTTAAIYHFAENTDDKVTRVTSTINVIEGLGISYEWNKRTGEEAHKGFNISFTRGIF